MPDTTKPITVSANAPLIDLLTAAGRYIVVIASAIPIILKLLGDRNFVEVIQYFRAEDGSALIAAIVGLATLAYGLWKTRGRAVQVTTLAGDERVPSNIAHLK